jgi:hypothetical protein
MSTSPDVPPPSVPPKSIPPAREEDMARLREAAKSIGVDRLRDGSWFRRVVAAHVKEHFAKITPGQWDRAYPGLDTEERAHKRIVAVARQASAAGALSAVGTSTGELLSLVTDGLAAPVGVPAAIVSMLLEAAYTARMQIGLTCDLASIYGVPFDANDFGEVATLFALALEVDLAKKTGEEEHNGESKTEEQILQTGLTAKLMQLEEGDVAARIGRKLLEESLMRNVLPVIGIAVSARWNYVASMKLGSTVKKYVRYRRALVHSFKKLKLNTVDDPGLIVEGAWLLATVDGEAGHEEVLAIALIMDQLTAEHRRAIALDKTLGDDEEEWFDSVRKAPRHIHAALLDTLYMIAATDRELRPGERRFLRRVGKAVGEEIDLARVAKMCRHFTEGEDLPDGILSCVAS